MTSLTRQNTPALQVLIAIGLTLIVVIGMSVVRFDAPTAEEAIQQEVQTYRNHDIASIEEFRAPYVGDNSNTVQLLYALPLGNRVERVEIHDTDVSAMLDNESAANIQFERYDALYSAIAFMASVDNATSVAFYSSEGEYVVQREGVEERFGWPLGDLLSSEEDWERVRTLVPIEAGTLVE